MKLKFPPCTIVLAAFACIGAVAVAQSASSIAPEAPPAARAPDVRPPADLRDPGARPPGPGPLAARPGDPAPIEATVSGRVVRWLPNPNGDVDGLLLSDGTQITFPPRLSARLTELVKLQDNVQVLGRRGANTKVMRATQIKIAKSGQTFSTEVAVGDAPRTPLPPVAHEALTAMTASGRIATLLFTDRGDANGVLLDSGAAVRFPPHVGTQLADDLKVGSTLYARGYGTRGAQGAAFEATRIGTSESDARDIFPPRPPIDGAAAPVSPPQPLNGAPVRPADLAASQAAPASTTR
jgi:hypothetical protein